MKSLPFEWIVLVESCSWSRTIDCQLVHWELVLLLSSFLPSAKFPWFLRIIQRPMGINAVDMETCQCHQRCGCASCLTLGFSGADATSIGLLGWSIRKWWCFGCIQSQLRSVALSIFPSVENGAGFFCGFSSTKRGDDMRGGCWLWFDFFPSGSWLTAARFYFWWIIWTSEICSFVLCCLVSCHIVVSSASL